MPPNIPVFYLASQGRAHNQFIVRGSAKLLLVQCWLLMKAVPFGGGLHSIYCAAYGFSLCN